MPLLQWLPHSYVGPSQLHRNIIRGTMKCPGHWQLIWLTVQYFYQGNKPQFATEGEAQMGFGVKEGGKQSAKEQNRGFGKCFPYCTYFSFLTEMKAWLSAYELVSLHWCLSSIFPSITCLWKSEISLVAVPPALNDAGLQASTAASAAHSPMSNPFSLQKL